MNLTDFDSPEDVSNLLNGTKKLYDALALIKSVEFEHQKEAVLHIEEAIFAVASSKKRLPSSR